MGPITDTAKHRCEHCPEPGSNFDSNGDLVCLDHYLDGTAYVEPLDYALDSGAGW